MKQWLYNGWCRFKEWVLFNYWKRVSNEDYEDHVKLYRQKKWERIAMKAYVNHNNANGNIKVEKSESWYVGDIPHNWEDRIDAKILKKIEMNKDG